MNSRLGDIKDTEVGSKVYQGLLEAFGIMLGGDENASAAEADRLMAEAMVADMPLRNLAVFARDRYSEKDVLALIEQLNQ
jgi:beta-glucosidase